MARAAQAGRPAAPSLAAALAAAPAALRPWVDLLDRINVFPVADGDTGRNLAQSLAPLSADVDTVPGAGPVVAADMEAGDRVAGEGKAVYPEAADRVDRLLLAARGNSGNLAAQFLSAWLEAGAVQALPEAVSRGRARARAAVADPQPGTMLSLMEALDAWVARRAAQGTLFTAVAPGAPAALEAAVVPELLDVLAETVRETRSQQERLSQAGVVDAGALGLFVVLEACFRALCPSAEAGPSVAQRFGPYLQVRATWRGQVTAGFCVDAVIRPAGGEKDLEQMAQLGQSVAALAHGDLVKLHVHADDVEALQASLGRMGEVVQIEVDDMGAQAAAFEAARSRARVHLLTDGAGTFPAEDAARLGVTVLDSYIQLPEGSMPESQVVPEALYAALRRGARISTAQASTRERHGRYRRALEQGKPVLYLATGSAFTGNVAAAESFRDAEDCGDRFVVLDSGAASGRLGIVAMATAEQIQAGASLESAEAFARRALEAAQELLFLGELRFLARGGRLSRTAAFLGDALRMKPVVSPRPGGVEKVGVVRRAADQLPFLLRHLESFSAPARPARLLVQHTDNAERMGQEVLPALRERYPEARIELRRLSLTTGVHVGPGSWGLAWLPSLERDEPPGSGGLQAGGSAGESASGLAPGKPASGGVGKPR